MRVSARRAARGARGVAVLGLSVALLASASSVLYARCADAVGPGVLAAYAAAGAAEATVAAAGVGAVPAAPHEVREDVSALLVFEGDVAAGTKAAAEAALGQAPAGALGLMAEQGWEVVFTAGRDLAEFAEGQGIAEPLGVTVWAEKRIYVRATVACAAQTTLHEVGHWIDRAGGWLSSRDEWSRAWEAERGAYAAVSAYAASDAREMFAEVCDDVLLGRSDNQDRAPMCAAIARRWLQEYGFED